MNGSGSEKAQSLKANERVDRRSPRLASGPDHAQERRVRSGTPPRLRTVADLPRDHRRTQRSFRRVVRQAHTPILQEQGEGMPTLDDVADRLGKVMAR